MKSKPLLMQIFDVTLLTLLSASLFLVGCGASEDDNSQPFIETITDKTLNVDDEMTVEVNILDVDVDNTHIIRAFSDDTTVATVSVRNTTLTITGMAAGTTTVTVAVTDDSGQDNASAAPVTFNVTVNEPPQPLIYRGECTVGMRLKPGESCSYGRGITFFVRQDGTVCRESELPVYREVFGVNVKIGKICGDYDIERDESFGTNFAASKNPDGSWTIDRSPGTRSWPTDDIPGTPCQIPPLDEDFRLTPVIFEFLGNTCALLSDGDFVVFACRQRASLFPIVVGGQVHSPTEARVEFGGGDVLNKDGAIISDGELTEFEVSDTIEGVIELKNNRSTFSINVPKQDGLTIKGFQQLSGLKAIGTEEVVCLSDIDNTILAELAALAEDMLDIMRNNQ